MGATTKTTTTYRCDLCGNECGCPSELALDSSSYARQSWIDCHDCGYRFQGSFPEETLVNKWNKLSRQNMPAWEPLDD
jgi:DNA-directed RNA polymerase subunit RPC12/RpoP